MIARFENYTGLYPYHCHVLEHEDYEMMRQFLSVATTPACQDGIDNDGDGRIDWAGLDLNGDGDFDDPGEAPADPQCSGKPFLNRERSGGGRRCGLGAELALLALPAAWLGSRRRRRS